MAFAASARDSDRIAPSAGRGGEEQDRECTNVRMQQCRNVGTREWNAGVHEWTTHARTYECMFGHFAARHGWRRVSRVAAEYSSICLVRSSGYEISTSVISSASSFTASSLGMTKAVSDGRLSLSTRATTSSRNFGSKCTP